MSSGQLNRSMVFDTANLESKLGAESVLVSVLEDGVLNLIIYIPITG